MIRRYARFFRDLGVKKGDRVALSMPNCPEFICTYLGASMAGAVVVPLNLLLSFEEITYIVRDSAARVLVIHPAIIEKLDPRAAGTLPSMQIQIVVLNEQTKARIAAVDPAESQAGVGAAGLSGEVTGAARESLKAGEEGDRGTPKERSEDNIAALLYTSGTTGKPKGAMLTHRNLLANVRQLDEASDLGPDDNFLCVLPMFHSFGWTVCVLLPLYLGSKITILDGFKPKETFSTIVSEGITVFCGVPAMFAVLAKMPERPSVLPNLKLTISGGAPLPEAAIRAFDAKFGATLLEGYGLSEASPVVSLNPIGGIRKIGSIGIPLPGVEVRIVDENLQELPRGEVGELAVRGDNVMVGYWDLPDETQAVLVNGWLLTGDLARMDEDGYIYIVDRKKDVIIISGFNVYPREVEDVIFTHPKVQDVAVVGVNDPVKGEIVKAYIIPKEGEQIEKSEIVEFLKPKLARYKMPQAIEFAESLPRSPSGKVLKRLLR